MQIIILLFSFFCGVQFCYAQGNYGNATNNSNTGNTPTLFEINTNSNSNSAMPLIQDTIQFNINDEGDDEMEKKEESIKIKSKEKSQTKRNKDEVFYQENTQKISSLNPLNQHFSFVYNEIRTQKNQRNPTKKQQEDLNKTLQTIGNIDSTSFDYHLMKVKAGNYDVKNQYHLSQASELNKDDIDVQKQLVAYYVITSDSTFILSTLNDLVQQNQLTEEFIDYGSDLLISTPENSTLITHSFDDTYSVLLNQLNYNERTDVTVINLDFCQSQEYRNLLIEKGYQLSYNGAIDTKFLADFVKLNPTKKIALSMTIPKDYFLNQSIDLGICGLVFIPGNEINLDEYNQMLWENQLTKKILHSEDGFADKLSKNYLPLLLELKQLYHDKKQFDKKQEVDDWITKIAEKSKITEQLKKLKD
jgi:hypothetical protein